MFRVKANCLDTMAERCEQEEDMSLWSLRRCILTTEAVNNKLYETTVDLNNRRRKKMMG